MPRNSWTSFLEEEEAGARREPSAVEVDLLPELERLRRERRELEARMDQLTDGTSTPVGDARRYPVTPLAQRRTEDAWWARRRDGTGVAGDPRTRPGGQDLPADSPGRRVTGRGESGEVEPFPPLRTQQRALLEPLGRIGDGDARSEAPLSGLPDRFTELEDRFTPLPDRFTDVDTPTAGAARRVEALTDRFTGLQDPRPLRDRFTERMRRRLQARDRLSGRAAALAEDPPLRSARDRYEARREELLALRTGGSGDLDDRSIRGRVRALARLRMKREREAADDARVERARARAGSGGEP